MSKRDNFTLVLMTYNAVNLQCDNKKLQCRYIPVKGEGYGTWWINGEDTGLQVSKLIKELKMKYKEIRVLWKRRIRL